MRRRHRTDIAKRVIVAVERKIAAERIENNRRLRSRVRLVGITLSQEAGGRYSWLLLVFVSGR